MTHRRVYVKIQVPPHTKNPLYAVTPVLLYEMYPLYEVVFVRKGKAISPSSQTTGSSVNSSTQKLHTSFTFTFKMQPNKNG